MTTQRFSKGDIVRVADDYPWIWRGGKALYHMTGHGELATVVGSYTDQYEWGGEEGRHQYTLEFEKHGRVSWYDEDKLTLVMKKTAFLGDFESKFPTKEEMIALLEGSLEYVKACDSQSDFDHALGRWQLFLSKAPPIYDENGSL